MRSQLRRNGLSLLELIAVTAIVGVLAVIVLPRVTGTIDRASEKGCYHNRALLNSAIERYYLMHGRWPTSVTELASDTELFPQGVPACPVSGVPYAMDLNTHRIIGHAASGGKKGADDPHGPRISGLD